MSKYNKITPEKSFIEQANITAEKYEAMYAGSINQPEIFWAVQSKRLDWFKRPTIIKNASFEGDVSIKWYEDGKLNACYNCVDRHLEHNGDKTAFIFEKDEPDQFETITHAQAHEQICKLAFPVWMDVY